VGQIPEDERCAAQFGVAAWPDKTFEAAIQHALGCGTGLKTIGRAAEELAVRAALELEGGSVGRAARRLKVTDRALQLRLAGGRKGSEQTPAPSPSAPTAELPSQSD
jgi:hypothetical protein